MTPGACSDVPLSTIVLVSAQCSSSRPKAAWCSDPHTRRLQKCIVVRRAIAVFLPKELLRWPLSIFVVRLNVGKHLDGIVYEPPTGIFVRLHAALIDCDDPVSSHVVMLYIPLVHTWSSTSLTSQD